MLLDEYPVYSVLSQKNLKAWREPEFVTASTETPLSTQPRSAGQVIHSICLSPSFQSVPPSYLTFHLHNFSRPFFHVSKATILSQQKWLIFLRCSQCPGTNKVLSLCCLIEFSYNLCDKLSYYLQALLSSPLSRWENGIQRNLRSSSLGKGPTRGLFDSWARLTIRCSWLSFSHTWIAELSFHEVLLPWISVFRNHFCISLTDYT